MKTYEVKGEMRWEGIFSVEAESSEEAKVKIRDGDWDDWLPTNLCDWAPVEEPYEI